MTYPPSCPPDTLRPGRRASRVDADDANVCISPHRSFLRFARSLEPSGRFINEALCFRGHDPDDPEKLLAGHDTRAVPGRGEKPAAR